MLKVSDNIVHFLERQGFVIVSTIDSTEFSHTSCKGMLKVEGDRVYLVDLYWSDTYQNLKKNPLMSITAVDKDQYIGYCLKGRGKIVKKEEISPTLLKEWQNKKAGRTTSRIIKNIRAEKRNDVHPEASFPEPQHLIIMEVEEIVDLTRYDKKG
ncbi:MAG: pyridoxamine 5'-phosphate oxidase family protein [Candidatus Auribacterota bacterium]|nr:pyridoxamine 5'-phosphate oxidase family protein [Candidatus Auribacterota bacterium]